MGENFTIAPSLYKHTGFSVFTEAELYELITANTGLIRSITLDIQRQSANPLKQKELKHSLPIALANGIFNLRRAENLIEYSKFIIIDLDYNLPQETAKRDADLQRIRQDPYTRLAYLSPRNGIKVLVEHNNTNPAYHEELYDTVAAHFGTAASVDSSCRDLPRANFICYDPGALLNLNSKVFQFKPSQPGSTIKLLATRFSPRAKGLTTLKKEFKISYVPSLLSDRKAINEKIAMVQKWSNKKFPITKGSRNANTFRFACVLHDHGVSINDALNYLTLKYVAKDFLGEEIEQIILKAYN